MKSSSKPFEPKRDTNYDCTFTSLEQCIRNLASNSTQNNKSIEFKAGETLYARIETQGEDLFLVSNSAGNMMYFHIPKENQESFLKNKIIQFSYAKISQRLEQDSTKIYLEPTNWSPVEEESGCKKAIPKTIITSYSDKTSIKKHFPFH